MNSSNQDTMPEQMPELPSASFPTAASISPLQGLPAYDPWHTLSNRSWVIQKKKLADSGFHPLPSDSSNFQGFRFNLKGFEGELKAEITVQFSAEPDGRKTGLFSMRMLDAQTGEEYRPFYLAQSSGSYVLDVRNAWENWLEKFAKTCLLAQTSSSRQRRLAIAYAMQNWNEAAGHPFAGEEHQVLRHAANEKWYAIFMKIPREKLPGIDSAEDFPALPDILSCMTVKTTSLCQPDLDRLIFPGYHMNHEKWSTIVLDGKVSDESITEILAASRQALRPAYTWIVPANPAYFDLSQVFDAHGYGTWKQTSRVAPGDLVYIYAGLPAGYLMYQCQVVEINLPCDYQDENLHISNMMKLKLLQSYPPGLFDRKWLQSFHIASVRSARRMPQECADFLKSQNPDSGCEGGKQH